MKPNQCIALLILMMVPLSIHAQRNPSINLSSVSDPNERAKRIVQKILEVDGRSSVSIKVKEDKNIKNALAWMEGPTRIIKYNPDFLSKFGADAQSKTATIALFAHEVGHHVLPGHTLDEKDCTKKQTMELEADYFAGRIMNLLCIEEDAALFAFRNMGMDVSSGCYPRPQVREATVKKGWRDQDQSYAKDGQRHPCDVPPFPLKLQTKALNNRSQNVEARIVQGSIMEVRYFLPAGTQQFEVFFGADPLSPYKKPSKSNIEWLKNPYQTGEAITMRWHFGKDGLLVDEVHGQSDSYGVMAYIPKYGPRELNSGKRILWISGIVAGAAALGYGVYLGNKSKDKHDTYKNNRNPNDESVYATPGDRDKLYDEANALHKTAWGLAIGGGAVATVCTIKLCQKSKSNKQYRKFLLFSPR